MDTGKTAAPETEQNDFISLHLETGLRKSPQDVSAAQVEWDTANTAQ